MNYHYDKSHKAPSVMAMDHPHPYSSLNHHPEIITSTSAPLPSDLFYRGEERTNKESIPSVSGRHEVVVTKTVSSSPRSSPSRRRSLYPRVKHVTTRMDRDPKTKDYVKDRHSNSSKGKGCYDTTKSIAAWDKFEKTNKNPRQQQLHHSAVTALSLSSSNIAGEKVVQPSLSKDVIHQTQLRRSRPLTNSDPRCRENFFSNLHNSDTRIVYDRREKIHQLYHHQEEKQDQHKQREEHKRNPSTISSSSSSSFSSSSLSKSDILGDLISRLRHSLSPQDGIDGDQDKRYKSVLDILAEVIELFNQPSYPFLQNNNSNGSTNATNTSESSTTSAKTKGCWSTRQLLPFLLQAMNSYKTKKLVQLRSVIIFTSFVTHNVGIKSFFTRNRAISTTLGAMRDHPTYYPLQLCGCQLFDSLLEKAGGTIFTIFNEEGGLERVLQATSNHSTTCDNGTSGTTTRTQTSLENVTKSILNKLGIIVRKGQLPKGAAGAVTTATLTATSCTTATSAPTTVTTEAAEVTERNTTSTTTTIGTTSPTSTATIDTLIADIVGLRLAALEVEILTPMQ